MTPTAGPPAAAVRGGGGVGRKSSVRAEAISDAWRRSDSPLIRNRRRVTALSLGAAGALGAVSLYQTGVIGHLPEPGLRLVDADGVDAAGEAYSLFSMPDGVLGVASYAVTAVLATMGGPDRYRRAPWLPLALAAKVAVDVLSSGVLTAEQATRHKRFCSWCLATTAATLATVPAVLPEAAAAWRQLRGNAADAH